MTADILSTLRERIQESRRAAVAQFREHERPDTLLGDLRRAVEQAHKAAQHLAALPRLKPTPPANGPASVTPGAE